MVHSVSAINLATWPHGVNTQSQIFFVDVPTARDYAAAMEDIRDKFIKVRVSSKERERFTESLRKHGLELSAEMRRMLENRVSRLERKGEDA